jgi:hypothetical protein
MLSVSSRCRAAVDLVSCVSRLGRIVHARQLAIARGRRGTDDTKRGCRDTRTIHPVGLMVSSEALQMSIISPSASGSSASPNEHRCREALRDNEPAQSEERYALAMESINEGAHDWDIAGAVYISPLLRSMSDLPAEGATSEVGTNASTQTTWRSIGAP